MVTISVEIGLPLLWGEGAGITAPRRLRAVYGAEAAGAFPVTLEWDAPESWGNDTFDQIQSRRSYHGEYVQLTNADGTPHTGANSTPTPFNQFDDDTDHRLPSAPNGSIWRAQVQAINRAGARSEYAVLTFHPTSGLFGFRFGNRFD